MITVSVVLPVTSPPLGTGPSAVTPIFVAVIAVVVLLLMIRGMACLAADGSTAERFAAGCFALLFLAAVPAAPYAIWVVYTNEVAAYAASPRVEAAGQRRTAPAILTELSGDARSDVRVAVAANPSAPEPALDALGYDRDEHIRATAAFNRSASPETLRRLASDRSDLVRSRVGENPSTPPEVLRHLTQDPVIRVRLAAVGNRAAPGDVASGLLLGQAPTR